MEDKFHGAYALLTQEVGSVPQQTTIAVLIISGICVCVDKYVVSYVSTTCCGIIKRAQAVTTANEALNVCKLTFTVCLCRRTCLLSRLESA